MTTGQILTFVAFVVAATGTPGPGNALLLATGASVGVRRGLPALIGIALAMGLLTSAMAVGLAAVIFGNPTVATAVKWCGAALLLWLAWKIATAKVTGATARAEAAGFVGATAFQLLNPKAWLVTAGAAAAFLEPAGGAPGQAVLLGLMFALASLPTCGSWLVFGAVLHRWLRTERARRVFNGAMGAVLAASVGLIVR